MTATAAPSAPAPARSRGAVIALRTLQVLLARVRVGDEGRAGTEGAEPLLNNDQNK